jgi:hypothetical protein
MESGRVRLEDRAQVLRDRADIAALYLGTPAGS